MPGIRIPYNSVKFLTTKTLQRDFMALDANVGAYRIFQESVQLRRRSGEYRQQCHVGVGLKVILVRHAQGRNA